MRVAVGGGGQSEKGEKETKGELGKRAGKGKNRPKGAILDRPVVVLAYVVGGGR